VSPLSEILGEQFDPEVIEVLLEPFRYLMKIELYAELHMNLLLIRYD